MDKDEEIQQLLKQLIETDIVLKSDFDAAIAENTATYEAMLKDIAAEYEAIITELQGGINKPVKRTAARKSTSEKKARKQKSKPENEAESLMKGLDFLHIKYLHVWFVH